MSQSPESIAVRIRVCVSVRIHNTHLLHSDEDRAIGLTGVSAEFASTKRVAERANVPKGLHHDIDETRMLAHTIFQTRRHKGCRAA